jgi:hypothetical protein
MDETTHTVTLPLEDYQELKQEKSDAQSTVDKWKEALEPIATFVSMMADSLDGAEEMIKKFNDRHDDVQIEQKPQEGVKQDKIVFTFPSR